MSLCRLQVVEIDLRAHHPFSADEPNPVLFLFHLLDILPAQAFIPDKNTANAKVFICQGVQRYGDSAPGDTPPPYTR